MQGIFIPYADADDGVLEMEKQPQTNIIYILIELKFHFLFTMSNKYCIELRFWVFVYACECHTLNLIHLDLNLIQ